MTNDAQEKNATVYIPKDLSDWRMEGVEIKTEREIDYERAWAILKDQMELEARNARKVLPRQWLAEMERIEDEVAYEETDSGNSNGRS